MSNLWNSDRLCISCHKHAHQFVFLSLWSFHTQLSWKKSGLPWDISKTLSINSYPSVFRTKMQLLSVKLSYLYHSKEHFTSKSGYIYRQWRSAALLKIISACQNLFWNLIFNQRDKNIPNMQMTRSTPGNCESGIIDTGILNINFHISRSNVWRLLK